MSWEVLQGDALEVLRTLPDESVHCCVTSPPYWGLRDYGTGQWAGGLPDCDHVYHHGVQGATGQRADRTFTGQAVYKGVCRQCGAVRVDSQLGLESTIGEYLARAVEIFREVRRVLRNDGTLWLNMGDSYCSDAGTDRKPTTLAGPRVPAGWTNRSQPKRIHAARKNKDCDPKRGSSAAGQPLHSIQKQSFLKPKDLCMMPARVAIALQDDGWWLRSDIIWHKPNPMPESVTDRPTKAHEYLFLLAKSERYFYDAEAIKECCQADTPRRYERGRSDDHKWADGGPGNQTIARTLEPMARRHSGNIERKLGDGTRSRLNTHLGSSVPWQDDGAGRNKRSVWTIPTQPFAEAHFATFPEALVDLCVLAGCPVGGIVLDPFCGSGTVGVVALGRGRQFIGIELNPAYCEMARKRIAGDQPLFNVATEA